MAKEASEAEAAEMLAALFDGVSSIDGMESGGTSAVTKHNFSVYIRRLFCS